MTAPRNGASRPGGEVASDTAQVVSSMFGMLQSPAANGLFLSQKLALEAARFWAQRMRAYADQLETLAQCANPNQFASAQADFLQRMQRDYTQETSAMSEIIAAPPAKERERPNA